MPLSDQAYLTSAAIQNRITELASELDRAYADSNPYLVTVLNGGKPFADALASRLSIPHEVGTIQARSYIGETSTGAVEIETEALDAVADRYVLLIEDILDTGRTASELIDYMNGLNPASLRIITLLDKPSRRVVPIEADWVGFTIEDHFVVGFGMDYNGDYRDLDDIRILEP